MNIKLNKWLTGLLLLTLTNLSYANTDKENIQQLIQQYEKALNAGNTKDILKLYGEIPTFMPQHAPAQVGKEVIEQAYNGVFTTIKLDVKFTIHALEVFGDTAWARTSSAGKTKILANNAIISEGNNELFIFKKEHGEWKIHQYLFATNQARN